MYAKFALTALFVCSLYNSAYSSLLECDDTDNPGELLTSIIENSPAVRRFSLRAPEDGNALTPISCIIFESKEDKYHVEIVDGGLGAHFVELDVYAIHDDDDDDRRHDDDDDEFALAYQFSVFREYRDDHDDRHHDDDDDDRHHDDDDDRHHDDDDDRRHDDDDDDRRHH